MAGHVGHRVGRTNERAELGFGYGRRRHHSLLEPRRRIGALGPDLEVVVRHSRQRNVKKGGAKAPPFFRYYTVAGEICPVTYRHQNNVESAKVAEIRARSVKGSAVLMVNKKPDTPAAIASEAVLEVA